MPLIMGTAGHIDHGKTTLVKALTGIDCDRLEEERRRGITIELGFAFMDLSGDRRLGIVDVPGHERFVKNMVAGASGIDFVLLIIAADEGVMPQTREHLEICSLLGLKTGIVALTKTDMVDEEWLEMVQEDVHAYLEGTFLEEAPVIPVSAHTGQGLDTLRAAIEELIAQYTPHRPNDLFRIPIDRVFTMKGHGTVVTGTMTSGSISLGEEVVLYPDDKSTKVRGLQSHGSTVETALAGLRTAVNLPGLEVADIQRGEILARPGTLFPHEIWDIKLTCLESSPRPLKNRKEIHFHHGCRELQARLFFPDRDKLSPGETAICQVRFTEPMVGVRGDHCVIRAFSPLRTVAGGVLLNPLGGKIKKNTNAFELVTALASEDPQEVLLTRLRMAGSKGMQFAQMRVCCELESKKLEALCQQLASRGDLLLFDKEERSYIHGECFRELADSALSFVRTFHDKEPLKLGLSRGLLASGWGGNLAPKLFHFLVERLLKRDELVAEQELLRLPEHKVTLAADQAQLEEKLRTIYAQAGLTPPNLKDVLEELDLEAKEIMPVMRLLQERSVLVKVKEEMYFSMDAVQKLEQQLLGFFADNDELGPPEFKDLTGLSRKYIIPLLEFFDKQKFTVRVGDKRRLRKR